MDKKTMEQINVTVRKAEEFHDNMYDLVEACNMLLKENERLESRHKADRKAVEEANAIADRYMKECKQLHDRIMAYEKSRIDFAKPFVDMMNCASEIKVKLVGSDMPTWDDISKVVKNGNLKHLKTYSTKDLVDELKNREGVEVSSIAPYMNVNYTVEGPAIVLTVID